MEIVVKFFGLLKEDTGTAQEIMTLSGQNASDLLEEIYVRYPQLKQREFRLANNLEFIEPETELKAGELALLPPFSGG